MAKKEAQKKQGTKTRLKKDDQVIVISGKEKRKTGPILAISRENQRVLVQGVNLRKHYSPPTQENPQGGEVERERPLHLSNVAYYDNKVKKASRIRMEYDKNGNKVRVAVASGRQID